MAGPGFVGLRDLSDIGAATAEHRDGSPAAAARDLGPEETLRRAGGVDQGDEKIGGFGAQAARGVARVGLAHQLPEQFGASFGRRRLEKFRESADTEVLVNRMGRAGADRVLAIRVHPRHRIRDSLVGREEFRPAHGRRKLAQGSSFKFRRRHVRKVPAPARVLDFHPSCTRARAHRQSRAVGQDACAHEGGGADGGVVGSRHRVAHPGVDAPDLEIGGEREEQKKSFRELAIVLVISVSAIFIALIFQFRSAVKPLIVFAAIPFGAVASLVGLRVMSAPFGFMAFLGVISLIGVIVSHVIVLFDFIEERREEGAALLEALPEAGLMRLRPVLVTVLATVLGLVPLALHGGPLWQPLCYVQIAGLTFATLVTLVIVPVLYAIFVLDLRLVRWDAGHGDHAEAPRHA